MMIKNMANKKSNLKLIQDEIDMRVNKTWIKEDERYNRYNPYEVYKREVAPLKIADKSPNTYFKKFHQHLDMTAVYNASIHSLND